MKRSQKNILFITSLLDRMGGAEKNLCEIVLHLDRKKYTPHVLAFKGGELSQYLSDKGIDASENHIQKLISFHTFRKGVELCRFIRNKTIDVIVTYHHDADILGAIVGAFTGVPVISSRRDMGYQLEKKHIWFYRIFSRLISHFITVSDAVKQEVMKREWINAQKITIIRNGLDIEKYHVLSHDQRHTYQKEIGLSDHKLTIGMVASFRPIKGQMYLVEAISMLTQWHDSIQVVIVGYKDTDYFLDVKERVRALGLESLFVFTGERADVPDILNLFDIFVISSVNEGFSNAIIEAMAAGIAVVAADSGGNREAVAHRETGLLFRACDSQSLAEALNILLKNEPLITLYGQTGRSIISEKFLLNQMVESNERIYDRF